MVENVWGLVAVLVFYVVILVIGIVAGRKELQRKSEASTTETMLAGRDIGMVSCVHRCYMVVRDLSWKSFRFSLSGCE